ncbi:MAG: hypothetical protein J5922_00780, partial [Clostridia bacterium]|nr:hypothetical protein [Clostridia bacterium]
YLKVPSLSSDEYKKAENLHQIFEGGTELIIFDAENKKYLKSTVGIDWNEKIKDQFSKILGKDNVVER